MANYLEQEWNDDPLGRELWFAVKRLRLEPKNALAEISNLADQGSPMAQLVLGDAYLDGRYGLSVDAAVGEKFLRNAANTGLRDARYRLAKHYIRTSDFGRAQIELEALAAAEHAPAINTLAVALYKGVWITKDAERAVQLWRSAEKQGLLVAKRWLAYVYRNGEMGSLKVSLGFLRTLQLTFLYPFYLYFFPKSDRLRD